MPNNEAVTAWRRDCSTTPLRASIMMSTASAVDAPVTMLRVYCTCPRRVCQDELARWSGEVAVGNVDGNTLLPFDAQAIGDKSEVHIVAVVAPAGFLDGGEYVIV